MKDLEYYMGLSYTIIIKPAKDGGYIAYIKELPGCITQGETLQEISFLIEDAKESWILTALEDGDNIPEPDDLSEQDYSGKFNIRIPKSLHRDLAKKAKNENVSLNQLTTYLLSSGVGKRIII